MNLFSVLVVVAIVIMASTNTVEAQQECQIGDDDFFPLVIAEERENGFAGKVIPTSRSIRKGQNLILSLDQGCISGWRLETSGAAKLFHTSEDANMCLQAGHGSKTLTSGTKMRIYPCDANNSWVMANAVAPSSLKVATICV